VQEDERDPPRLLRGLEAEPVAGSVRDDAGDRIGVVVGEGEREHAALAPSVEEDAIDREGPPHLHEERVEGLAVLRAEREEPVLAVLRRAVGTDDDVVLPERLGLQVPESPAVVAARRVADDGEVARRLRVVSLREPPHEPEAVGGLPSVGRVNRSRRVRRFPGDLLLGGLDAQRQCEERRGRKHQ
jgi:hypothetical protein